MLETIIDLLKWNDQREKERRERRGRGRIFKIVLVLILLFTCGFLSTISTVLFKIRGQPQPAIVTKIEGQENKFKVWYKVEASKTKVFEDFTLVPRDDGPQFDVGKPVTILVVRLNSGNIYTTIQGYETTESTKLFMIACVGLIIAAYAFKKSSERPRSF